MPDIQANADRTEIEALRGEFTDAGMTDGYDRFASLFTQRGTRADRPGTSPARRRM